MTCVCNILLKHFIMDIACMGPLCPNAVVPRAPHRTPSNRSFLAVLARYSGTNSPRSAYADGLTGPGSKNNSLDHWCIVLTFDKRIVASGNYGLPRLCHFSTYCAAPGAVGRGSIRCRSQAGLR